MAFHRTLCILYVLVRSNRSWAGGYWGENRERCRRHSSCNYFAPTQTSSAAWRFLANGVVVVVRNSRRPLRLCGIGMPSTSMNTHTPHRSTLSIVSGSRLDKGIWEQRNTTYRCTMCILIERCISSYVVWKWVSVKGWVFSELVGASWRR